MAEPVGLLAPLLLRLVTRYPPTCSGRRFATRSGEDVIGRPKAFVPVHLDTHEYARVQTIAPRAHD